MNRKYDIALIGGRSLVLKQILALLETKNYVSKITIYASKDGVNDLRNSHYEVKELKFDTIARHDVAFFSGGDIISLKYCSRFIELGAKVIDNSAMFRLMDESKLVAAYVNDEQLLEKGDLYCNPNCVAIMIARVLKPLHELFKMEKIIVSSYQSASGMGKRALDGFMKEKDDETFCCDIFPSEKVPKTRLYDNVIPLVGNIEDNSYTAEENKIRDELKKIFNNQELESSITAVRNTTTLGHAASVHVTFEREVELEKAYEALKKCEGIVLKDFYSDLSMARNSNKVYVSRLRNDLDCQYALTFFVTSDNLLVGASYNAIYILEQLIEKGILK